MELFVLTWSSVPWCLCHQECAAALDRHPHHHHAELKWLHTGFGSVGVLISHHFHNNNNLFWKKIRGIPNICQHQRVCLKTRLPACNVGRLFLPYCSWLAKSQEILFARDLLGFRPYFWSLILCILWSDSSCLDGGGEIQNMPGAAIWFKD